MPLTLAIHPITEISFCGNDFGSMEPCSWSTQTS